MKVLQSIAVIALLLTATLTQAGTLDISWDGPNQRTDDVSLPQSEIQHYRVEYGTLTGNYSSTFNVEADSTSTSVTGLAGGTYFVVVTVVDTLGAESVISTEAFITLPSAPPKPVTNLMLSVGAL